VRRAIADDKSGDRAEPLRLPVERERRRDASRRDPPVCPKLFASEGVTFSEYVLDRRLCAAHRLLTNRRLAHYSIASVAFDSGFADLSYFNRTFRRRYNATPTDVRLKGAD
jgi:methylphosphotriester-DNA--protein-cysteine methyltransferase